MNAESLHFFNMLSGYTLGLAALAILAILKLYAPPLPNRYNSTWIKAAIVLTKAGIGIGVIGLILQSIINFDLLNNRPHSFNEVPVWMLKDWGWYLIVLALVGLVIWIGCAKKLWWVALFVALGWGSAFLVVHPPS